MKKAFIFFYLVLAGVFAFGQEVSEKQEIAVFNLSYYDWKVPSGALGLVDEEIKDIFINIGRFDVLGMNYRLGSGDINEFIDKIREVKEESIEIPESVRLGQEAFTEADFNALIGSFIVVIPSVVSFRAGRTESGAYRADIKTSFTFINIDELKSFAYFTVDTIGLDDRSIRDAVEEAASDISVQLTYEIRKMPVFQLKSGIIDVLGQDVLIEFGADMGVKKGDEYVITRTRVLDSGHKVTEEKGLLVIKEVRENVSIAKIIWVEGNAVIGDQVREVPRIGTDTTMYVHAAVGLTEAERSAVMLGARQSVSRGMYRFRPIFGLEFPLVINGLIGFPMNLFAGGELNWYFRRMQAVPLVTGGVGGVYDPNSSSFIITNWGFKTGVFLNFLVSKSTRIGLEGGYTYWFGTSNGYNYGGPYGGLVVLVKY